jgi:hypothetical protein
MSGRSLLSLSIAMLMGLAVTPSTLPFGWFKPEDWHVGVVIHSSTEENAFDVLDGG